MRIPNEGSIVEWHEQPSSILTGIIENAEPVRRVGRVNHYNADATRAVIYDHDGIRASVPTIALTVLSETSFDGWGVLA